MRTKQLEDLGYRTFKTVAERDAYLTRPNAIIFENLRSVVYDDPTPANNAVYRVNGSNTWVADASASAAIFDDNYDFALWDADASGGASRRALAQKFDEIDTVLALLAPEQPNRLDEISGLAISQTTYSGFIAGTSSAVSRVLPSNTADVTFATSNGGDVIYDSTQGDLSFQIDTAGFNGEQALITFTSGDDTGLSDSSTPNGYVDINVTEDEDFYLGQAGSAGFWFGFEANGNVNVTGNGFVVGTTYDVTMNHTNTGSVSSDFKLEDTTLPVLTMSAETIPTYANGGNGGALSGVPSFDNTAVFQFDFTATAIAKSYRRNNNATFSTTSNKLTLSGYSDDKLNDVSVAETVSLIPNAGFSYNPGSVITVNGTATDILNQTDNDSATFSNVYWDFDTESVRRRYSDASATSVVSATAFQNSTRDNDTGGTNPWDDFVAANELQRVDGSYEYPSTNYTGFTPAGPDYSVLTGERYATFVTSFSISNTDNFVVNTPSFTGKLAADFGATDNTGSPAAEPNTRILVSVNGGTTWFDATLGAGVTNTTLGIDGCLASNGGTSTNTLRRIQLPAVSSGTVSVRYVFSDASTQSVGEPTAQAT